MNSAADIGRHSSRAMPSLHDDPYRQSNGEIGRRSTYPAPITVQRNQATSVFRIALGDKAIAHLPRRLPMASFAESVAMAEKMSPEDHTVCDKIVAVLLQKASDNPGAVQFP